ncbi:hypothetical protein, partial [Desulfonatronospira sp. MSAO_Bac3]|uniref:hypothetical protein n=1 Tax=Desulfonatronospira sp. MSAO_Bac3 TaxID=2293857 RepID=UPI002579EE7B
RSLLIKITRFLSAQPTHMGVTKKRGEKIIDRRGSAVTYLHLHNKWPRILSPNQEIKRTAYDLPSGQRLEKNGNCGDDCVSYL